MRSALCSYGIYSCGLYSYGLYGFCALHALLHTRRHRYIAVATPPNSFVTPQVDVCIKGPAAIAAYFTEHPEGPDEDDACVIQ